jgi:hypothetical protein
MYVYAETILIRGAARGYRSGAISAEKEGPMPGAAIMFY